jgi:hypothetical protein
LRFIFDGAGDLFTAFAVRIQKGLDFTAQLLIPMASFFEERGLLIQRDIGCDEKDTLYLLPGIRGHRHKLSRKTEDVRGDKARSSENLCFDHRDLPPPNL